MKVLFLTQTSEQGPASRHRVYQYLDYLRKCGIECDVHPAGYNRYYTFNKVRYYITLLPNRLLDAFFVRRYDVIFIQREFIPYLYPFLEMLICKLNHRIIFDFDDPIYLVSPKIYRLVEASKYVIVSNEHLKAYALKYNSNVALIPTVVDTNRFSMKSRSKSVAGETVIGWIGTPTNLKYLREVEKVLGKLSARHKIVLKIVGASGVSMPGVKVISKKWSLGEEVEDIKSFDIGIMPLRDDQWSRGKSGLKLLQYMSTGVPAVATGSDLTEGIAGDSGSALLARSESDWFDNLERLIERPELRAEIGGKGRGLVESKYSVQAQAPRLREIIETVHKMDRA